VVNYIFLVVYLSHVPLLINQYVVTTLACSSINFLIICCCVNSSSSSLGICAAWQFSSRCSTCGCSCCGCPTAETMCYYVNKKPTIPYFISLYVPIQFPHIIPLTTTIFVHRIPPPGLPVTFIIMHSSIHSFTLQLIVSYASLQVLRT
jgi:hypothetical protein